MKMIVTCISKTLKNNNMENSFNGFIVLQLLGIGSYQPVFSDDEGLMVFNTEEEANREIMLCVSDCKDAVKKGDMSGEYSIDDYRVIPATLTGTKITCSVDGDNYEMQVTDDDFVKV